MSYPTFFCLIASWSHHQKSEYHLLSRSCPKGWHEADIKEKQSSYFWTKFFRWEHCRSESSLAGLCKRVGGRGNDINIFGCKFRKEKAKTDAVSCRGHLRSHSTALHTWAKADLTFPSHIPGQAAQLNAHSTSKETLLWMCSFYHIHQPIWPKTPINSAQNQKKPKPNRAKAPLPSWRKWPWLGE